MKLPDESCPSIILTMARLVIAIVFCWVTSGVLGAQSLQIHDLPEQGAIAGQPFALPLTVTGGTAPYMWRLDSGEIPPGCALDAHSGRISGTPDATGVFRFTVAVSDSSIPASQVQREFNIHVIEGLTLDWKEPPQIHGNAIRGSAVVSNETGRELSLTVVVVAVNEIGRATTLGYEHFRLAAGTTSPAIPFAASPGVGTYYVRADAAAHRSGHHHVYRTSKQTEPMKISQF